MGRLFGMSFRKPQSDEEGTVYLLAQVMVFLLSVAVTAAAGMTFVLIAASHVNAVVAAICTALLCALPPFIMKALTALAGYADRAALTVLMLLGFIAGLLPVSAYFVSHDYEMSVYRYMRVTRADVYYYGGYDALEQDYVSPEAFMSSMKDTSASVILNGMGTEELAKIDPAQLDTINSESLWDYFGFEEILGSHPDEVEDSLTASRTMDAYEFTFDYRGLTAKSFTYMLKHPRLTLREIGLIARTGTQFAEPLTLLVFLAGELIMVYVISMHFGVNDRGEIVCYTSPEPPRHIPAFFGLIGISFAEMKSGWLLRGEGAEITAPAEKTSFPKLLRGSLSEMKHGWHFSDKGRHTELDTNP